MAIGDPYAILAELKTRLGGIADTDDDAALNNALATASRGIDAFCRRQFNKTTSATARVFRPTRAGLAFVHDFHTTTGLVIATGDDGTFGTTWAAADYQLEPLNQMRHGEEGWPYWIIRAVDSQAFTCAARATLQVTAQWGWNAVPAAVKEACLILAVDVFKLKDTPFGVAGYGDWGVVRVRQNPAAAEKLIPYRRNAPLVA
ncbi:hypothetical protein [Tenggerimyces flavus]|uniref:Phage gp6-like head-tail connector protein n=1 Tax=Tenggerimyces flavus TaxID=1708749 RepID=A0ABV7YBN5_9ACTN|nr:hypothetical protein [Tenggerimyces flavus]MBM7788856.1 hypothetical protein [Tenggerimyces flavus]